MRGEILQCSARSAGKYAYIVHENRNIHKILYRAAGWVPSYTRPRFRIVRICVNTNLKLQILPNADYSSLDILGVSESAQPEESFPAGAETRPRGSNDVGLVKQLIKKLPR